MSSKLNAYTGSEFGLDHVAIYGKNCVHTNTPWVTNWVYYELDQERTIEKNLVYFCYSNIRWHNTEIRIGTVASNPQTNWASMAIFHKHDPSTAGSFSDKYFIEMTGENGPQTGKFVLISMKIGTHIEKCHRSNIGLVRF